MNGCVYQIDVYEAIDRNIEQKTNLKYCSHPKHPEGGNTKACYKGCLGVPHDTAARFFEIIDKERNHAGKHRTT